MKKPMNKGRRRSIELMAGLTALTLAPSCLQGESTIPGNQSSTSKEGYDLNDPKDLLLIFEKLRGDLSGKMTFNLSEGRVFGIRPDLPDDLDAFGREVFRYTGCSMRIKRVLDNGNVETKSRSWLLYQDPKTGAFLDKMTNPYTGEVVDVPPFRGGIRGGIMTPTGPQVDANFQMKSTAFGRPLNLVISNSGKRAHITRHAFTQWFEKKSQTNRTEMTLDTYDFDRANLEDRSLAHIPADSHWTSQTAWLSLLKMAGTPGHMLWCSSGGCLFDKSDLPAEFIAATESKQPEIFGEALTWD